MKRLASLVFRLLPVLLIMGCVSEIDFLKDEFKGFYVINGVISNSPEDRQITIGIHDGFDTASVKVQATGKVFKDDEFLVDLIAERPGVLSFPETFMMEVGARYYVEITTVNNFVFRTEPTTIAAPWQGDSMSFDVVRRVDGVNASGAPAYSWFVDVFTYIRMPQEEEGKRFLRTMMAEAWSVQEVRNPVNPTGDIVRTCYLSEEVTENESFMIASEDLVPGTLAKIRTGSTVINSTFLSKHYFNCYIHSISQEAYDFYVSADNLISNQGTIFDEIPAPLTGNVYNVDPDGAKVYGYVDLSLSDTIRLGVHYSQLGRSLFDKCTTPGVGCNTVSFNGGPPPPCDCYDCHLVYGFESLYKPDYWVD